VSDEVAVENEKSNGSVVKLLAAAVLSLVVGYAAGAFTGQPLIAALGIGAEINPEDDGAAGAGAQLEATPPLFEPMAGVFDPDKKRFYAEVGELLIAMPHRGATRHLQLTVQLVGHEEKYMKSVENDVPAIRNGLLIFFNQQEFGVVNTYEGREALRRKTLQRVNEIIGATGENRVADVYFTAYITQ
jgi:flagellar basal body-associated protein FliL